MIDNHKRSGATLRLVYEVAHDEPITHEPRNNFGVGCSRVSVGRGGVSVGRGGVSVERIGCAAGGVESAVAALAIYHDVVPPTINQETADPDCDLDCVPNEARKMPVRVAMNNSFGFGGTNCSLVLSKYTE